MAVFYRIPLGTCNSYLIIGNNGCILVDAGNKNKEKAFLYHLKNANLTPDKIKLIVITHVHFDHVGGLQAIKNICKCPVAVHEKESKLLQEGKFIFPPGTNFLGKSVSYFGSKITKTNLFKFVPVKPDIVLTQETSLEQFGVNGSIVPTPGHTEGSISVVLPTGKAFVGDLAVNFIVSFFPPFGHNIQEIFTSWRKLVDLGANTICPSHGLPFNINLLKKTQGFQTEKSMYPDTQLT